MQRLRGAVMAGLVDTAARRARAVFTGEYLSEDALSLIALARRDWARP